MIKIDQIKQIGSLIGMLIIFVLILYGSYVCSKKIGKMSSRDNQSKYMKLHDRMMLGQDKFLAIVSIGEKLFLIGTSADGIRMLTELKSADLVELTNTTHPITETLNFKEVLKKMGLDKDKK